MTPRLSIVALFGLSISCASHPSFSRSAFIVPVAKGLLAGLLRCGRCGRKLYVRYWGKAGTSARYVCSGDFGVDGGRYCIGFGGATVDRRFGDEIVRLISPLGIRASLAALEQLTTRNDEQRQVMQRQVEQLEYDARRAFEQYDETDPRNRLVASELERRWNAKLEELERVRAAVAELDLHHQPPSAEEHHALEALGEHFADAWNHPACPIELKKQSVRSVIEEALVDEDPPGRLSFIVHWKGGCHTAFELEKVTSKTVSKTADADLDVIRKMATRYGDAVIARVLNKLGRRTGKWFYRRRVKKPDGTRVEISGTPSRNTKLAAEAAERAHIDRVLDPAPVPVHKEVPTFAEWFMGPTAAPDPTVEPEGRFWLEWVRVHNKPSEQEAKRSIYRHHLGPALGKLPLHRIGASEIARLRAALLEDGASRKRVNNILCVLSKTLRYAVDVELLERAPKVGLLKHQRPEIEAWSIEEYDRLLQAARAAGPVWHVAVVIAGEAGLRVGEVKALRWEDVDLSRRNPCSMCR